MFKKIIQIIYSKKGEFSFVKFILLKYIVQTIKDSIINREYCMGKNLLFEKLSLSTF